MGKPSRKPELCVLSASSWFLACPYSSTLKMEEIRRLNFNGLYGFISQKKELSITTAVRTSKPKTPEIVTVLKFRAIKMYKDRKVKNLATDRDE
jgi:hypothetical protein